MLFSLHYLIKVKQPWSPLEDNQDRWRNLEFYFLSIVAR